MALVVAGFIRFRVLAITVLIAVAILPGAIYAAVMMLRFESVGAGFAAVPFVSSFAPSERAKAAGAVEAVVVDAREEFARDFCMPALRANAMYENRYPLVSALSRPVIVKHLVAAARYLGRYNQVYDEGRRVVESVPGQSIVEMDLHHRKGIRTGCASGWAAASVTACRRRHR